MAPHSAQKRERKLGRPREIEPEALRRAVIELQFVLEQNWGVVGWLLREAKSMADVRNAFAKIVEQRCRYLEPLTDDQTLNTTSNELRTLRKKVLEVQERHGRDYAQRHSTQQLFEHELKAQATASDPVKQALIQGMLSDLKYKAQEADSLEKRAQQSWSR